MSKIVSNEMSRQLVSFALMVFFTLIAFISVALELSPYFVGPFLLLLAVVQVIFQLFIFMHMEKEGHGWAIFMLFSGVFVALLVLMGLILLTHW